MFATNQLGGMSLGFPNVCLTPMFPAPIPIPYPSMEMGPMGIPISTSTILFGGAPVHNLVSIYPMTLLGPPGIAGVASGTVMGPGRPILGSFTVLCGAAPTTRMTTMSLGNLVNCPPNVRLTPSQVRVLLLAP